jgi:uncharacterized membrane protein
VHDLREVDRTLLWANNMFLLCRGFLPLPTALPGQQPDETVAAAFYGAVCTLAGFCFVFMRSYASSRGKLMREEIPVHELRRRIQAGVLMPVLYLMATAGSLISPIVTTALYFALPLWYTLGQPGLRVQGRVDQIED